MWIVTDKRTMVLEISSPGRIAENAICSIAV
jgi:hypothetical protein